MDRARDAMSGVLSACASGDALLPPRADKTGSQRAAAVTPSAESRRYWTTALVSSGHNLTPAAPRTRISMPRRGRTAALKGSVRDAKTIHCPGWRALFILAIAY